MKIELRLSKIIKLAWTRLDRKYNNRIVLTAEAVHDHGAVTMTGLREEHLVPVQQWCEQTGCGVRMAFNIFHFDTEQEVTAFLLKWG